VTNAFIYKKNKADVKYPAFGCLFYIGVTDKREGILPIEYFLTVPVTASFIRDVIASGGKAGARQSIFSLIMDRHALRARDNGGGSGNLF
jgi:hypothetical protein